MSSEYRLRWLHLLSIRNGDDASTPAPPEDQIEGSEKNPKGSAGGDSDEDIEFSEQTEKSIQNRVDEHNDCLLFTSPSPRDLSTSRIPSSA